MLDLLPHFRGQGIKRLCELFGREPCEQLLGGERLHDLLGGIIFASFWGSS